MSKVLVVDDDPHIRELVRIFLDREGLDVVEAADGLEAMARLETVRVDMVILDIMMPNLDGWELCRRLRQSGDFPILIITAKGETSQKIKGFQLGTDDYLVKPFEPVGTGGAGEGAAEALPDRDFAEDRNRRPHHGPQDA